jgi:hypothetical protein
VRGSRVGGDDEADAGGVERMEWGAAGADPMIAAPMAWGGGEIGVRRGEDVGVRRGDGGRTVHHGRCGRLHYTHK